MVFWQGYFNPDFILRNHGTYGKIKDSALVIDAKALYDCLRAEVPQVQDNKCTKIETMIVKEKMKECNTIVRWVSSEVQYSDGLMKMSARQLLADRLRIHKIKLTSDTDFVAVKKKIKEERLQSSHKFAQSRQSLATMVFLTRLSCSGATSTDIPIDNFQPWDFAWEIGTTMLIILLIIICIITNSKKRFQDQEVQTTEEGIDHMFDIPEPFSSRRKCTASRKPSLAPPKTRSNISPQPSKTMNPPSTLSKPSWMKKEKCRIKYKKKCRE